MINRHNSRYTHHSTISKNDLKNFDARRPLLLALISLGSTVSPRSIIGSLFDFSTISGSGLCQLSSVAQFRRKLTILPGHAIHSTHHRISRSIQTRFNAITHCLQRIESCFSARPIPLSMGFIDFMEQPFALIKWVVFKILARFIALVTAVLGFGTLTLHVANHHGICSNLEPFHAETKDQDRTE
jgi:hypothetical protein